MYIFQLVLLKQYSTRTLQLNENGNTVNASESGKAGQGSCADPTETRGTESLFSPNSYAYRVQNYRIWSLVNRVLV